MRLMNKKNINYAEFPITEEVIKFAQKRGITQAPIVVVYRNGDTFDDAEAWGGFRPDRILALAKES